MNIWDNVKPKVTSGDFFKDTSVEAGRIDGVLTLAINVVVELRIL